MGLAQEKADELVELERELTRKSLYHFSQKAWHVIEPGRRFVPGWHIQAISEHLEAVFHGEIRNLLINVPPRHMKSIETSVLFPAWAWANRPEIRWLFSSYAESLSIRDSVKCRRVIQSEWYQKRFGHVFQLTGDQNEKKKYENDKTGHRIATSVMGAGTGEGGDIIVADDPHKVMEAESDTVRQHVLDWWDGEMSTRGNDPKTVCKVIVMQRVHEKDLSGHVLAEKGYEHLCLPAEFEPERKCVTSIGWEDPREKAGALLWPDRFGAPQIAAMKRELGSYRYAGQGQQRPAPAEGNIFKRAWWKFWTVLPSEYDFLAMSVDLPFSEGPDNSYAVFGIWLRAGADKYLIDMVRDQIGFNDQCAVMANLAGKWNHPEKEGARALNAYWIEKKANGAAMLDTLKKKIPALLPIEPRGSKVIRAQAQAPQIESGNVYLPDPSIAPWVNDFIEEHAVFPNGAFDDQVDMTSQALMKLNEGVITDFSPVSLTGKSKWLGR